MKMSSAPIPWIRSAAYGTDCGQVRLSLRPVSVLRGQLCRWAVPQFGCEALQTRMDVVEEYLAKHPDVSEEDYRLFFGRYLSRAALTEIRRVASE